MIELHKNQGHAGKPSRHHPSSMKLANRTENQTLSTARAPGPVSTPLVALTTGLEALTLFRTFDPDSALQGAAPHSGDAHPPSARHRVYSGLLEANRWRGVGMSACSDLRGRSAPGLCRVLLSDLAQSQHMLQGGDRPPRSCSVGSTPRTLLLCRCAPNQGPPALHKCLEGATGRRDPLEHGAVFKGKESNYLSFSSNNHKS